MVRWKANDLDPMSQADVYTVEECTMAELVVDPQMAGLVLPKVCDGASQDRKRELHNACQLILPHIMRGRTC